jgi:hypothetical protein
MQATQYSSLPHTTCAESLKSFRYQPEYQPRGNTHLFHIPPGWSHSPPPDISQSTNHVEIITSSTYTLRGVTHLLQVLARVPTMWKYSPLPRTTRVESLTSSRHQPEYQTCGNTHLFHIPSGVESLNTSRYQPEYQLHGNSHLFHIPSVRSHSLPPGSSRSTIHVEILTSSTYHPCGVTHLLQVSAGVPSMWKYSPLPHIICVESLTSSGYQPEYQPSGHTHLFHIPSVWSHSPPPGISQIYQSHGKTYLFHETPPCGVTNLFQVSTRIPTTRKKNTHLFHVLPACIHSPPPGISQSTNHVEILTSSTYHQARSHSPPPGISRSTNHVEILTASTYQAHGVTHLLQALAGVPTTWKYSPHPHTIRVESLTSSRYQPEYQPRGHTHLFHIPSMWSHSLSPSTPSVESLTSSRF